MNAPFSPILSATIAIVLEFRDRHGGGCDAWHGWRRGIAKRRPSLEFLDGRTFVTQSGEKGKPASKKDTFVFRDGRFLSEACSRTVSGRPVSGYR